MKRTVNRYFVIHKPFQVLSQFSAVEGKQTLKDVFAVPGDVYPVGRLDYDSEGLLILTNDKKLNAILLDPENGHEREYWVQTEGAVTKEAVASLESGVTISVNKKHYCTRPAKAQIFRELPLVSERNPPIRERKNIPTTWMKLILHEGKNRQVRKMTAATGFPTLRLIRYRIERLTLENLEPGDMKEMSQQELYRNLKII